VTIDLVSYAPAGAGPACGLLQSMSEADSAGMPARLRRLEEGVLQAIHRRSDRRLDRVFSFSRHLGTVRFCTALVAAAGVWHLRRGRRREAALAAGLGLGTFVLQAGVKPLVRRSRPRLWERMVEEPGFSFPSGHALAAATVFPIVAGAVGPPTLGRLAHRAADALAAYVSVGRLYLGLHWPSDVLAGWALAKGQWALGRRLLRRR
jgi:membrane-associated phospholipid phosphatase